MRTLRGDVPMAAEIPDGAVLIARAIVNSSLWTMRDTDLRVAILCMVKCSWKKRRWFNGKSSISIERGQFITTRRDLAQEAKLSDQKLRTSLRRLEKCGFLTRKPTNAYTLITVPKYDFYQDLSRYSDQINPETNPTLTHTQPKPNPRLTQGQPAYIVQEGKEGEEGEEGALTELDSEAEATRLAAILIRDHAIGENKAFSAPLIRAAIVRSGKRPSDFMDWVKDNDRKLKLAGQPIKTVCEMFAPSTRPNNGSPFPVTERPAKPTPPEEIERIKRQHEEDVKSGRVKEIKFPFQEAR
jgi:predicted transcriptional regulator